MEKGLFGAIGRGVLVFFLLASAIVISFIGCSEVDVVAKYSATTFENLLKKVEVSRNPADKRWVITTPGGEQLVISSDFSKAPDFTLTLDAAPFFAAGLDPTKLPGNYVLNKDKKRLVISFDIGSKRLPSGSDKSILDTFKGIASVYRDNIGYHEALDHYGINLGNGNMFEWAREMDSNDKDCVIALNPEPLLKAGVDPKRVEGYLFAKVPVKEKGGKTNNVDKLIKAYNF